MLDAARELGRVAAGLVPAHVDVDAGALADDRGRDRLGDADAAGLELAPDAAARGADPRRSMTRR
jgi:hypothetical protein